MAASEFLIVLCSPNSAKSQWVNREVAWFKTHRDAHKILTVIIGGEPMASLTPGREAEECFPKTLIYSVGADLQPTERLEDAPLAADARESGDGKRGAKLKLAAAMLGVGFDALVRRDDRRRTQRRRLVYAGLAALSATLGGLSLFAFTQRDAARVAQADAEFQRDEAQSLVEFMLTDLRQRLDAVGRLDILDSVAKRLLESYEKQDLETLDPDSLGRRARVLLLLGEVEGTRGKLDDALARYKEAAATTEELLRRDPDDQQRIFDHAQSVYWVGDIALKRGDIATVTDYWTQYRDFGLRLVELDPDKDEWRTELAYGHRNLASLALDEGDAKSAEAGFAKALAISKALAAAHPADKEMQIALAQDYYWLGSAKERLGRFSEAYDTVTREAAIYEILLEASPDDDSVLHRQSVNGRVRARLALAQGDVEGSSTILEALFPLHQRQLALDPRNTRWLEYHGHLQIDVGNIYLAQGNIDAAREQANGAITVAERLVKIDPSVSDWVVFNQCGAYLLAARVAVAAGDLSLAYSLVEAVHANLKTVNETQTSLYARVMMAAVAIIDARIAFELSSDAAARPLARNAIALIESLEGVSGHQQNKTLFIESLMLAGELDKARGLVAELEEIDYRHPEFIRVKTELAARTGGRAAKAD